MTKDQVMKAFVADVVNEVDLKSLAPMLLYRYKENNITVNAEFIFYEDSKTLERIDFGLGAQGDWSVHFFGEMSCTKEYVVWHTNRLVQKFGLWKDKQIREFNYTNATGVAEKGISTSLQWETPRMFIRTEVHVSTNEGSFKSRTSCYPRRKYLP